MPEDDLLEDPIKSEISNTIRGYKGNKGNKKIIQFVQSQSWTT